MRSTLFASLACHACPFAAMQHSHRSAAPLMCHPEKLGGAVKLVGARRAMPISHATRLRAASSASATEVEIKLRLPSKEAHDAVAAQLKDSFRETHQQENFFFDGVKGELSSQRVVLRCRFYNTDKRAIVTLKGGQVITEGVGRGSEVEDDVDPVAAREFLTDPSKLLQVDLPFIKELQKKYDVTELRSLGGFENVRSDYDWEGFKLELDETKFDWGTVYEIEVETPDPDQLKAKLELFLKSRDIPYKYNTTTKFANFINRKLD